MDAARARRIAGRMLMVGFPGKVLEAGAAALLRDLHPAGIILFSRNYESLAQVTALIAAAIEAADDPQLLVAIDQEGGKVNRFTAPFTLFPGAREIGATANDYMAYEVGKAMATELLASGVNVNLAPVLDVDSNPQNPIIGPRSFGPDPYLVSRMAMQMLSGMQDAGILACGKHFPGHGDTSEDSHLKLPSVDHGLDRLLDVELVPFADAIDAGIDMIMTAHVVVRGVDPDCPATLSSDILTGLLKTRMGFRGVVVTDDLEMKAIADNFGRTEAALSAVRSGADLLLVCHTADLQVEIRDALAAAIEKGDVGPERANDASDRVTALKKRVLRKRPDPYFIGCIEHARLAEEIRDLAC
ncbi:MAG: beta-N-acetylhexosaminidase [Deltaproteobacteria bacterium]|nr:beta-N-acetylhexosaminidase [Deltaproteobacteria bacterium]